MLKKYYKQILLILCFGILFVIIYYQYEEKKVYEVYISENLNREMQQLVVSLVQSNHLYQEILQEEEITKFQVHTLNTYTNHLIKSPQKYEDLAVRFNRMEPRATPNETAINAEKISHFFYVLRGNSSHTPDEDENEDDVIHELDNKPELKEKIKELQALNTLWAESAQRHIEGLTISKDGDVSFDNLAFIDHLDEYSLTNDYWVDLVKDLDQITNDYLIEKQIRSVDEILNQ
ncbi:hypothetical protein [Gracilibacillus saliphilus]|uniref:hypothetical protein n=1 Tax=Gracilibacillus saliphilus TaxID=543890 RepID=UPI0013D25E8A|nr:hypothetical protein [Gracilibacillus saliphilus]